MEPGAPTKRVGRSRATGAATAADLPTEIDRLRAAVDALASRLDQAARSSAEPEAHAADERPTPPTPRRVDVPAPPAYAAPAPAAPTFAAPAHAAPAFGGGEWRPPAPSDDGIPWARYGGAIRRRWRLVAVMAVVGVAAGLLLGRIVKPEYQAHGTLWISADTPEERGGERGISPIRSQELFNVSAWQDLLTSFAILDQVARRQRLYLDAEPEDSLLFATFTVEERFQPGRYTLEIDREDRRYQLLTPSGVVERGRLGASIGRPVGFDWAPPAGALSARSEVRFTVRSVRDASLELRRNLSDTLAAESNLLRVTLRGDDPERVAATLNTLLDAYVATAGELKRRNLVEFTRTLEEQLQYAETQLREAELTLRQFGSLTITGPLVKTAIGEDASFAEGPAQLRYFAQRVELDSVRHDRMALVDALRDLGRETGTVNALWNVGAVQTGPPDLRNALLELSTKESALRAARQLYTDEHKVVRDLQRDIAELRTQSIPGIARALTRQLAQREADLERRLQATSTELRQIPTRAIEEMQLRREVALRENLYKTLQGRYEEARVAAASAIPDVAVLDHAMMPQEPVRDAQLHIALLALVGGTLVGGMAAVGRDRSDSLFRHPGQVTELIGHRILGAIPRLDDVAGSKQLVPGVTRLISESPYMTEAIRSVRLAVDHAVGARRPVLVTVTSPGPGEGKSLVSSNLAASYAQAGYRTLLVDGDIRRGALHAAFDVERRPGLIDYLLGDTALEDVCRPTAYRRLTLVPSGTRWQHGPELLLSPCLGRFLDDVADDYDVIIVDSCPLGAGTDPFALSVATGSLLLVLRNGRTDMQLARAKLRVLDRLPVLVLGAVLNETKGERTDQYYAYLDNYRVEDEEMDTAAAPAGAAIDADGDAADDAWQSPTGRDWSTASPVRPTGAAASSVPVGATDDAVDELIVEVLAEVDGATGTADVARDAAAPAPEASASHHVRSWHEPADPTTPTPAHDSSVGPDQASELQVAADTQAVGDAPSHQSAPAAVADDVADDANTARTAEPRAGDFAGPVDIEIRRSVAREDQLDDETLPEDAAPRRIGDEERTDA